MSHTSETVEARVRRVLKDKGATSKDVVRVEDMAVEVAKLLIVQATLSDACKAAEGGAK